MSKAVSLLDLEPDSGDFMQEALAGLRKQPATLPCKYFYDKRGANLFEQICELPEYYPTRTEISILRQHLAEAAQLIGPQTRIVEYGSGAGEKIKLLLDNLEKPSAYTPIDISREQLIHASQLLQHDYPTLEVLPVCADYAAELSLPTPTTPFNRTVVFFPGSTIGNFNPDEALGFLKRFHRLCLQGAEAGMLLIGYDLKKDRATLEAAYNDSQGVTAEFNLNLLHRINNELDGHFAIDQWDHEARWNESNGAVEMHLVSRTEQVARINGDTFPFKTGQSIHTENSFKYSNAEFKSLAEAAGFRRIRDWSDAEQKFEVALYQAVMPTESTDGPAD